MEYDKCYVGGTHGATYQLTQNGKPVTYNGGEIYASYNTNKEDLEQGFETYEGKDYLAICTEEEGMIMTIAVENEEEAEKILKNIKIFIR